MNSITILNNKKCQLSLDDLTVFRKIDRVLSFRLDGVEYTSSFKDGHWDGITHLLTKRGIFPIGLLSTVLQELHKEEITPNIVDRRPGLIMAHKLDITNQLKIMDKTPRDHQQRALMAIMATNDGNKIRKGIIRAATGSGKTLITAMATAELNKPTIVYVIGLDLLKQFHQLFTSIFEEKIGFIGNGICDIQRINIASVWTVGRALGISSKEIILDDENDGSEAFDQTNQQKIIQMLKETKVHLFDECHSVTCSTFRSIYDQIDPEYIFGFSGTPYRDDNSDLLITGMLGEKIIDIPASELIEKGLLVQPTIKFISIPRQPLSSETYQSVYKKYVVENEERNQILIQEIKNLLVKKYKILVLTKQIKHQQILNDLLIDEGIAFEMLNGNDGVDRRQEVKELLNTGKIDLILASTIFDIGVDISALNALVLCGGGKSSIKTLQRIGRVIRQHPGKKFVAVVDTFDNTKYLKKHSLNRYQVYCQEAGFKVFKSSEM